MRVDQFGDVKLIGDAERDNIDKDQVDQDGMRRIERSCQR